MIYLTGLYFIIIIHVHNTVLRKITDETVSIIKVKTLAVLDLKWKW